MTITLRELESTAGLMVEPMMAHGRITRCMAQVSLAGQMAESTSETMYRIAKKALVSSSGQMGRSIEESGSTENSMARENTLAQREKRRKVFGRTVSVSNGLPVMMKGSLLTKTLTTLNSLNFNEV
ncbi:MAG: hypothetical protein V2I33_22605 [Kangiellaceae bacterium]|nr:hypothetical protein [Kangiellaceae bacterium]